MLPSALPKLTVLWAIASIAMWVLAWVLRREWRSPFTWYVYCCALQEAWQWSGLAVWLMGVQFSWRHVVYYPWLVMQFACYALVACIVSHYAWLTLRRTCPMPGEFPLVAGIVAVAISSIAFMLSRWQVNPDARPEIRWSQGAAFVLLWLLVCAYLAARYYIQPVCNRLPRDIMRGLIATFGVAWLTSCMRSYIPATREQCWCLDLGVQLGAVCWWLYAIRRERA